MDWNFQKIIVAKALENYRLYIEFDDGLSGTIDLSKDLWGPMFEPLKDPAFFNRVTLDHNGAPCWPNEVDLAPDALYNELKATKRSP
jgi:hypothetical protein